ncbi:hypothetical protein Mapa_002916 [Marchantia paleacea]|nr:hypothetical protein Mapa_002916 [Marchantia paleacea]
MMRVCSSPLNCKLGILCTFRCTRKMCEKHPPLKFHRDLELGGEDIYCPIDDQCRRADFLLTNWIVIIQT